MSDVGHDPRMAIPPHPSVVERLGRLALDQRAAATSPPGPVLCVAPAGSGKTTTLVARVAWLVDGGADPATVCIVAFNKRAAEELTDRVDTALAVLGIAAGSVRVRTFHALGREILRDAGVAVEPLADRDGVLRDLFPGITASDRGRLDLAFSRLKLDLRVTAADVATDPAPGPVARAFVAYEEAVRDSGGVDFDDLLVRALAKLRADEPLLARWRARTARLLVDEAQDLDRTQLELALLLAAPANDVFLVGDDDQTIYSWRLADVRRVLGLAAALPGLRRVDLETNYRCPPPVVERAVRLVEHNRERFAKRILAGSRSGGSIILAGDAADDPVRVRHVMAAWPRDGSSRAVLARTNRELLAAVVAALDLGVPFRAPALVLPIEDPRLDGLMDRAAALETGGTAPLLALGRLRAELRAEEQVPSPTCPRRRTRATSRPYLTSSRPCSVGLPRSRPSACSGRPSMSGGLASPSSGGMMPPSRWPRPTAPRDSSGTTCSCSPTGSRAVAPSPMPPSRSGRWRRSADWRTSPGRALAAP